MFIKICGTTNLEDARLAVGLGADALGLIFAPSKRRVTVEQAAAITGELPPSVERVGVFTRADAAEIVQAVRRANLTTVQLHRPHDSELIARLLGELGDEVKLWQAVGFEVQPSGTDAEECLLQALAAAFRDSRLQAVLLDTAKAGVSGGLGEAFPWERAGPLVQAARSLAGEVRAADQPKLIVAGGLDAGNVQAAVAALRPWGVDVVSGVEANPGRKDPVRLADFLRNARLAMVAN